MRKTPVDRHTGSPLSVAILSASLSRRSGGILPIMQNHAIQFASTGVAVSAHGVRDAETDLDRNSWAPVDLYVADPAFSSLAYAPSLKTSLRAADPNLLHLHGLWQYPSVISERWGRNTGRPVVISTQGMLEPWALSNSRLKKRIAAALFERKNLMQAAVIHCSRSELPGIRAFGLSNPVAILPNGATLPTHRSGASPPWPQDGRKTLLFLGRLHPKKGISETLAAWAMLARDHPDIASEWRLVLAGWDDGGHEKRFVQEVAERGLGGAVVFPGAIFGEEKAAAFEAADAFILASHSEGFPMAVLEAWSHSLPVFKTRECNIPEGFDSGAAIEVTTDPERLARVLSVHLAGEDLPAVGERGYALVRDKFSWRSIAEDLMSVYRWTLGHEEMPSCIDLVQR
jgi:glycosyltransferase involved in cell wall biosynthesis